ncbi:MAG: radical SAM protein [Lachnospiraceae bacterium]|nr:radical SAM protein [Lachnospiraceae bacterium]
MDNIRIALWGYGELGVFLKTAFDIKKPVGLEFVCFGDDKEEEESVVSAEKMGEMYRAGEIQAVVIAVNHSRLHQAACQLMLQGIFDLYYMPHYYYELSVDEFTFDLLERIDTPKPRLEYLEFHLTDHCNLNCKGCAHLSNIATPYYADLEQFIRDLQRIKELFWGIDRIRLMGGEPLLNRELPLFIEASRNIFPDADIYVVSNGLMIDENYDELLRVMSRYHCGFNISQYPPTVKNIKKIRSLCYLYKVPCLVSDPIKVFRTCTDPEGLQDPEKAYKSCDVTHCTFLREGTISNCIMPYILPKYSEIFGKEMTAGEDDIIDIYDPEIDGLKILEKLYRPMECCRYCNTSNPSVFPWETAPRTKARIEDWVYDSSSK